MGADWPENAVESYAATVSSALNRAGGGDAFSIHDSKRTSLALLCPGNATVGRPSAVSAGDE